MGFYERLGLTSLINAAGTYTRLGGSCMPPEVLTTMKEAASSYVDMFAFRDRVGERLSELTRNEAALVSTGAAAALYVAVGACIARRMSINLRNYPISTWSAEEIVMFRAHRNPYDWAVRQLGLRLVEVGFPNVIDPPSPAEMEAAFSPRTAGVLFVAGHSSDGGWVADGGLPLDTVVQIARKHDVPVIVDAAAQLPPVENLWRFTEAENADVAIFSGGKDLSGPQASGLMVGKRDFISRCKDVAFPNYGIERMLKVGREEMAGLLAAVERYVSLNHVERMAQFEERVNYLITSCSRLNGCTARRDFPSEAGQPTPRAIVTFDPALGLSGQAVVESLMAGSPAIATTMAGERSIFINPTMLRDGEIEAVADAVVRLVA